MYLLLLLLPVLLTFVFFIGGVVGENRRALSVINHNLKECGHNKKICDVKHRPITRLLFFSLSLCAFRFVKYTETLNGLLIVNIRGRSDSEPSLR